MVIRSPGKSGEKFGAGNLMAFGFGFNKQKVLGAAEKYVQQGKLPNAISEYEKILKADPKDLTVMNTVGDLHSRLGETDKAAECFKSVGDAYASQGFTVKAIAMYKKLSKLKASMECVLRLAELYTQQGLFNDARAQYLQVAEEFLKTGQLDQAVRIFEKTLEMDPDNVTMRTKLAEVYVRLGKKEEAWKILIAAAESLRAKGQLAAADEILQRMLKLEPGNSYPLMLRGKAALEAGDAAAAIEALAKVPDLDTNPEGLKILFQAYLRAKRLTDAGGLATKLATVHDDIAAIQEYADALIASQQHREALQVYEQYSDRLLRQDSGKFVEALQGMIGHVKDDPQALEMVLGLFQKAGETTHLTEVYELLAHAYTQGGDLEKAREYYLKLTQLEPANPMHAQNYQQVLEKKGTPTTAAHPITAEEGSALVDELEATAPFIEQRYDDAVALALRAAMTDAELFISYNMPAKALAPLISVLPKAPRDLLLNQKLAGLHTRAGRFAEAGVCCRTLESIYRDAGHADEASRYADLAAKYEEQSGTVGASASAEVAAAVSAAPAAPEFEVSGPAHEPEADVEEAEPAAETVAATRPAKAAAPSGLFFHGAAPTAAAPPAAVSPGASAPVAAPSVVAPEAETADVAELVAVPEQQESEVDLSNEWEQDLQVEVPQTSMEAAPVSEMAAPEEVVEAQPGFAEAPAVDDEIPVEAPVPAASSKLDDAIEEVRFYLGQGMTEQAEQALVKLEALAPELPEIAMLRLAVDSTKQAAAPIELEQEVSIDEPTAVEEEPAAAVPTLAQAPQPWPHERPVLQEMVSEIEESLGDGFLAEPGKVAAPPEPAPETVVAQGNEFRSGTLDDFVSDLEASLEGDFLPAAVAGPTTSAAPAAPTAAVAMAAAAAAVPASRPPVVTQPPPAARVPAQASKPEPSVGPGPSLGPGVGVDLSDMFGELKQELESGVTGGDEDPETHYNLGVAFREMGLLDEAIGELQKVIQAVEHGHEFPQMIQTYTWLAQCFLDKGVPEVAVRWYEKALQLPSLDQETKTALHYELGSSFETAGNKPAALSNFLEAYGSNIDYRDVAERIKALRP
jgi:tetratricopeptide (TPR) repeat protein